MQELEVQLACLRVKIFLSFPAKKWKRNLSLPSTVVHFTPTFLFLDECNSKKDKQNVLDTIFAVFLKISNIFKQWENKQLSCHILFMLCREFCLFIYRKEYQDPKFIILNKQQGKKKWKQSRPAMDWNYFDKDSIHQKIGKMHICGCILCSYEYLPLGHI